MTTNVRPVGDRVLVEPVEEKETKGKKGDRVLVSKYGGGTEIKLNGKDYKILNSDDILAVIE